MLLLIISKQIEGPFSDDTKHYSFASSFADLTDKGLSKIGLGNIPIKNIQGIFESHHDKHKHNNEMSLSPTKDTKQPDLLKGSNPVFETRTINVTTTSQVDNLISLTRLESGRKYLSRRFAKRAPEPIDSDTLMLLNDIKAKVYCASKFRF